MEVVHSAQEPAPVPEAQAAPGLYGMPALLAMLGIALVILLSALDQTIVGAALPQVVADLQGFELYAWVATSYLLTSTVMLPIMGKLGDLYGRKPFLLAAIVVFVLSSAAAGAANSMLFLIIARGVQGIGAGMLQATAFASVGDMFPQPERRARWQGIITSTFGIASVVGPALGGVMTDHLGWRSVFYVNLPIGAAAILMLWFTLPANLSPRAPVAQIDWAGAATMTAGISALLLVVEWGGSAMPWTSPGLLALLLLSVLLLVAFVLIERRVAVPLLPLDLFRNRAIALCNLISLLTGFTLFGLIFFTPLLAQGALGLSASAAGAIQTPLVVCMALGSLLSGQTFGRTGKLRPLLLTGASLLTLGALLLTQVSVQINHLWLSIQLGLCGLGVGMMLPLLTVQVQSLVPRQRLGVGTSTLQFLRLIGSTLGTAIIGAVVTGAFVSQLNAALPPTTDPRLAAALRDPQSLVSPAVQAQLRDMAQQLGPDGPDQLQALLATSRAALAGGIRFGFIMAGITCVLILALVVLLGATQPALSTARRAAAMPGQAGPHSIEPPATGPSH